MIFSLHFCSKVCWNVARFVGNDNKAINNPLSDNEEVKIGALSEFQKSNEKGAIA